MQIFNVYLMLNRIEWLINSLMCDKHPKPVDQFTYLIGPDLGTCRTPRDYRSYDTSFEFTPPCSGVSLTLGRQIG